jgi:hypothetical protein
MAGALVATAGTGFAATVNISGGGGALATAIANANANPGADTIIIDDSLDYSTAAVMIVDDELTIEAAPGQTPTITHSGGAGQVLRPNAELTIKGASNAERITIRHTGASTAPLVNSGANPALTHEVTLENVTLARQGTGTGFYYSINNAASATTLTNVNFTDGAGAPAGLGVVLFQGDASGTGLAANLDNVDFSTANTPTNRILVNSRSSVIANECNLSTGPGIIGSFLTYAEPNTLTHTFTDCTFGASAAAIPIYYSTTSANTVNIINPTIVGSMGQVAFLIDGGGTVNVVGDSPTSKLVLDEALAAGTILMARVTNGNVSFTDVKANVAPAAYYMFVDSFGDLTGPVAVTYDRCELLDRTGGYLAQSGNGNGNRIIVNVRNSIISGTNNPALTIFNMIKDNSTKVLNLEHATLFNPPPGWVLMQGDPQTTVNANYSILDSTGGAGVSGTVTIVGDSNLLEGFAILNTPATNFVGVGPIDYVSGRLTAEGLASGMAIGSTIAIDVDGTARPQGAPLADIGAHEARFGGPLLITLANFSALSAGVDQPVQINWSTASEIDNVGFNLARVRFTSMGLEPAGRVNDSLIPGSGTTADGATYEFVDPLPLAQGEKRGYFLVDVDANGTTRRHGPFPVLLAPIGPSGEREWMLY